MPDDLYLPILSCAAFLAAALKADGPLASVVNGRIYRNVAPEVDALTQQPPAFPYALYYYISDVGAKSAGVEITSNILYGVKIVGPSFASNRLGAQRIHSALLGASGAADGAAITCVTYEGHLDYSEVLPGGTLINHVGGKYRIYTERA